MLVEVVADGSADNKERGPGGWGAVLQYGAARKEISGSIPTACTSPQAELVATLEALKAIKKDGASVRLHTDSRYVVNTASGKAKISSHSALWNEMWREMLRLDVRFVWVRGHAGQEAQEKAHALANEARLKAVQEAAAPIEEVQPPAEVLDFREARRKIEEAEWPTICVEEEKKFGHRTARLYPFMEKPVLTPLGRGILKQAIGGYARVLLDDEPEREYGKQKFRATKEVPVADVRPVRGVVISA